MTGDLGDLGVLISAAFLAGERLDVEVKLTDGSTWIVSAKPVATSHPRGG